MNKRETLEILDQQTELFHKKATKFKKKVNELQEQRNKIVADIIIDENILAEGKWNIGITGLTANLPKD